MISPGNESYHNEYDTSFHRKYKPTPQTHEMRRRRETTQKPNGKPERKRPEMCLLLELLLVLSTAAFVFATVFSVVATVAAAAAEAEASIISI